ncbi:hydrogenase maturation protease [Microbacterium schleiferi]|uniref:hydrogenase maturation protease n=1 Tax=Microbacterium schleiferi TaxID=69362 RepID=UPI00311D7B0A
MKAGAAVHTDEAVEPWRLIDDGDESSRVELLIIGCGNILRGDDAAGPVLIRRLWEAGPVPETVRIADGGTSGMGVAFEMRHADRVLIIDASSTGAEPGTLFAVPGDVVAELPPAGAMGSHDFRWDHAIAFGRWLLGPLMPADIDVLLIEGGSFAFGAPLSPVVDAAVERALGIVQERIADLEEQVDD